MAHDVFISYSSKDKTVANAACAVLEGRGVRCWVAPRDIAAGSDWGESIIDAIAGSRVMVLVFSANANASPQVKREVERAVNKGVTVVPFRIENVPLCKTLEYFVSTPHWMDAYTQPLEHHLAKLADTVVAIVKTDPVEAASASSSPSAAKTSRVASSAPSLPFAPERRGIRRAGVPTALAVGLLGALVVRAMVSSTPSAAQADPAKPLLTVSTPSLTFTEDETPAANVPASAPVKAVAPVAPIQSSTPAPAEAAPQPAPVVAETQPSVTPDASTAATPEDARERAAATTQVKRLRVRSVVLIGEERYCVINGRRFEEGETVDGFRVDRITASRVVVAKDKFRFELRPQGDLDSRVVSRTNVDNGIRDENRSESQPKPQQPRPTNGGPTVYGPGPGGPPPGGSPPPPPPPPGGGGRPPRR